MRALQQRGANTFAVTTSHSHHEELVRCGAAEVIYSPPNPSGSPLSSRLVEIAKSIGGFHCAIDPFYDLYLNQSTRLLAQGGRYVSCGLKNQFGDTEHYLTSQDSDLREALVIALKMNLNLIFNCLGTEEDLAAALADYEAGVLPVIIDSVFGNEDAAGFLMRTFEDAGRFGKVVYSYN